MKAEFYDNVLTEDCMYIRKKVFIEEQGFKEEFDKTDYKAVHVVIFIDGVPCATGRLFRSSDNYSTYRIGRVAVLKPYRGRKLGNKVISLLEEKCRQMGGKEIILSAQCRAKGFYEKLGYSPFGEEFLEEYCPHIDMRKKLSEDDGPVPEQKNQAVMHEVNL